MGSWGSASVDEYLIPPDDRPMIFKSDDDVFDTLEQCLPEAEFEALPENESECRPFYDALPWVKAIIVNINLPDRGGTMKKRNCRKTIFSDAIPVIS